MLPESRRATRPSTASSRFSVEASPRLVESVDEHHDGERSAEPASFEDLVRQRIENVATERLGGLGLSLTQAPRPWRRSHDRSSLAQSRLPGDASATSARASSASTDSFGIHSTWPTVMVCCVDPSARFASSRRRAVSTSAPDSRVSGRRIANSCSPRLHEMSLLRVTLVRSCATCSAGP